jgi:hypothetical protein
MAEAPKRGRGRPKKEIVIEPKKAGRPKKLSIAEKEEKALQEEQAKKDAPEKKGGRPRNTNYVSYEEARDIVREQLLHSRAAYEQWYEREKPKVIPRFPYRVYKEWVSWNDFLGTNNEFSKGAKSWRPFKEAIHFAHSLNLKTQKDWLDYCRDHSENVPEDIPRRPDVVYDQWVSWMHWLGSKPVEAVQAKVEAQSTAIFYIIHHTDVPGNVLTYGVENAGLSAMRDWWEREKFDVVKLFWYEQDKGTQIKEAIDALSTPYLGEEKQRITPNVWQIVEYLQTLMVTVRN